MPFRNRRDRVVVFRVTEEEYKLLLDACDEKNGRNLSDFARTELLHLLQATRPAAAPTGTAGLEARIAQIEARLTARASACGPGAELRSPEDPE